MKYAQLSTTDILEDLCDKIRKLELEPGSKISENEMASTYNVSRSSIRTVFSKLEQMFLILRYPQIGTFISPFDLTHIRNALYIRNLVELDAVEEIIKLEMKESVISSLQSNIHLQEMLRDSQDYEAEFKKIDTEFHKILLNSVGKAELMDIIKDSSIHIDRWKNFDIWYRKKIKLIIEEHTQILESIKTNDLTLAKKVLKKHLLIDDFYVKQARVEFPNYF
jgi:DNA-binding GntR family transcriptional regulator